MLTFGDIARNDLRAAEQFYLDRAGRITGDEWRVLYRLQDDPAEFAKLSRRWYIVPNR